MGSKENVVPILVRLHTDSKDPRQLRVLEWYENHPVTASGRKSGIQSGILDLLVAGIEALEGGGAPSPARTRTTSVPTEAPSRGKPRAEEQAADAERAESRDEPDSEQEKGAEPQARRLIAGLEF